MTEQKECQARDPATLVPSGHTTRVQQFRVSLQKDLKFDFILMWKRNVPGMLNLLYSYILQVLKRMQAEGRVPRLDSSYREHI